MQECSSDQVARDVDGERLGSCDGNTVEVGDAKRHQPVKATGVRVVDVSRDVDGRRTTVTRALAVRVCADIEGILSLPFLPPLPPFFFFFFPRTQSSGTAC